MYFEEEEEYMSEPIDEKSESSYIKINKRFLEQLKQTNQIDDLSRYRQDSDDQQETKTNNFMANQKKSSKQKFENHKIDSDHSPIKSNFYKDIVGRNNEEGPQNDSIAKSTDSKNKSRNETPEQKRRFMKLTQKISKLSHFDKKQVCTPADNTFEYYLLRKSHDRKYKDSQLIDNELHELNHMNDLQTKHQLFSPKHQVSSSKRNQNQQKTQFQRINYKKLLQNEISKNKDLEKQVYKLESKVAHLNLQYEESTKYSKKLEKQLHNSNKIRKQNKNRMKELDLKLEGFKSVCRLKNNQKDHLLIETKKQNKMLKQQNQKYRIFTETLAESIFVLKGKKPKNLQDIWQEWKDIFETFSKNKWTVNKTKSPNKRA